MHLYRKIYRRENTIDKTDDEKIVDFPWSSEATRSFRSYFGERTSAKHRASNTRNGMKQEEKKERG